PFTHVTYSTYPLAVALFARRPGSIVASSHVGRFFDQIDPGATGFFIDDPTSLDAIAQTVQHVLNLSEEQRASIRRQAYEKVVRLYDFEQNFPATLRWFWGAHSPQLSVTEGLQ